MNFKSHLRTGALMLGLSLCGGLLTSSAHAAPGAKNGKTGKAGKGGKYGKHGGGMKMMQELNLTDAQKAQLKPIMEGQRDKMKVVRADATLDPKAKKSKMKAMRADIEKQVNAILTPDQQQKMADMKAKRKAERAAGQAGDGDGAAKGRRGGPQAPAPAL